MTLKA
jgi:hypothetical protein